MDKISKGIKIFGLFILGLLILPSLVFAQGKSASPLMVLVEQDPWLMVIGSDAPSFALYDDGLLVYWDKEHKEYRSIHLAQGELKDFVGSLEMKGFSELNDSYVLTLITDQPTNILFTRSDGNIKKVSVYGNLNSDTERAKAPKAFLSVFDKTASYRNESAKTWLPEKIEVMIWPYEYAPEGSLEWPKNWPDINDPQTQKRDEGTYSLFIDSALFGGLKVFLGKLKEKQAVLINGKKYAVSYRHPFPGESEWMK